MKKLSTNELRALYLDFFVARAHRLIASDSLVPANDPSVLFTSAGMNQFKDYFLGKKKDYRRATSCQKCFRTGDLEQVGATPFHHTFFEMLGNFSFGDYFKKEAISWGWEFATQVLEIPPESLWVSVYQDDNEAFDLWKNAIGLAPDKIKKFGAKDNFWPSNAISDGPNGPCGPCSEIYYKKPNGESVEVWNLVFTQFDRRDGGHLEPLPNKNIDTGMGLERIVSVLQGVDSNFQIDIFEPIVGAVKKIVPTLEARIVHMLADHARAVTFCIGDGVLPSNDGRGYVVRKLIRRCQYIAALPAPEPFLYKLVASVAQAMREPYPEVLERRDNIAGIVKAEEEKYIRNILEGGSEKLQSVIEQLKGQGLKVLPPEAGLDLYVTYGVQPDFTQEFCAKAGIHVDMETIQKLIAQEQAKSRTASKMAGTIFSALGPALKPSTFVGYEEELCLTKIIQLVKDGREVDQIKAGDQAAIILEKTPFYAESGGQIADAGNIYPKNSDMKVCVKDVQKQDGSIVHLVEVLSVSSSAHAPIRVGDLVTAEVDHERRQAIRRSHTATHILQAVLRKVLGPHVQQAGSYVEPDRFRFDFTHFKEITAEEMDDVQKLLNDRVLENGQLSAQVMSREEAQKTGAIALFGEKYEDTVRVISIADYSKEFCGGTHLDRTGSIGLILVKSEASIGSGIRRIEAITGRLAFKEVDSRGSLISEISRMLKASPENVISAIEMKNARLRNLEKCKTKSDAEKIGEKALEAADKKRKVGKVMYVREELQGYDPSLLRNLIDRLAKIFPKDGFFVVSSVYDDNLYFACGSTSHLQASVLLKNALESVGGSGGGRKDFAQGGTKDVKKIVEVYKRLDELVQEQS